ncbi:MAG: hypothetical protein GY801_16700 [bacterium]|nr:hypothetical protein [bacterium]
MRVQKLYGVALVCVLVLGIAGCGLFDSRDPVGPANSAANSTQLANFWVKDGPGGKYEVSAEGSELEVSVPSAGQYMLTYSTMYGTFRIVFETLDAATLFIGLLQPGDSVDMAYIEEGDIIGVDELTVIFQTDILIAYLLPGTNDDDADDDGDDDADDDNDDNDLDWDDIFDGGLVLIILILDGEIVLEEADDDADDGDDDDEDGEDGDDGEKWEVTVSADGDGTVKPEGTKEVPDGASISIQFLPDSGMFEDISVTVNGEDFTGYLQQLGKKEGKQKGHLVIHGVDDDLEVMATFE